MNDQESHDGFEAFVRREAAGYNQPPSGVPRDEMWSAIAESRTARRRPRRWAPWIGMAATLILGVGIGRFALQRGTSSTDSALPGTNVTLTPTAVKIDSTTPPVLLPDAFPRRVPAVRVASAVRSAGGREDPNNPDAADASYGVASRQHLSRAEALVAVVAATPADAMMDSLTSKWARDVLSNTRLLLDSPAGDDPVRRQLLEDLESLLVQLVQRSGRAAEDRAMIDRTLQRTQLLTRLRSGATGT